MLLAAACSSTADETTSAESPLSSFDTAHELFQAEGGEITFGGPAVTSTGAFLAFTFWGNEGERVQLHVAGAPSFEVRRLKGIDYCKHEGGDFDAQFELTTVARGRTDAEVTIGRTGVHFVVIGAPGATQTNTVSVSAEVTRRPVTKGVRAVATEKAKTCAVLADGTAKCWGTTEASFDAPNRPGSTLASMGAGLAPVSLPAKAVDVALTGPGVYTTTSFLLEDGTVWSALEDAPLKPIALAGKAKKITGTCAWLEDDGVQCWRWDTGVAGAVERYAKAVRRVSATAYDVAVLLEGDELAVNDAPAAALKLEPEEHALDMVQGRFETCVLTNKAVRCGKFPGGVHRDGHLYRAEVPGEVVQFLADSVQDPAIVTKDGRVYMMTGHGWTLGLDGGIAEWNDATWSADRGPLYFRSGVSVLAGTNSAARYTQCAILEEGVLACAGASNVGQLGVGDCIDRETDAARANLPGLLLE